MTSEELKQRLRSFAIRIVKLVDKLPNTISGRAIGGQLVRSGTSPGTNYRSACIAKSDKDFINKLKIDEEELDESVYWLDIISATELIKPELLVEIQNEGKELLAIITRSIITKRNNMKRDYNDDGQSQL
ncbi:MAG: four helix bundle protein [Bacteroidota bacterium]|nr:four helix bundle protein [Bacteroidota bacterium]